MTAPTSSESEWWQRNRKGLIGCAAAAAALGVGALAYQEREGEQQAEQQAEQRATGPCGDEDSVVYRAEGAAGDYTISLPQGTQQGEFTKSWRKQFCAPAGEFLYVSIQNDNDSGSVMCVIEVNGRQVARVESSGAYVIASCED